MMMTVTMINISAAGAVDREFVYICWSRDPSHPLRVAILSNLPQELPEMVEYEPGNDLVSWKIMF